MAGGQIQRQTAVSTVLTRRYNGMVKHYTVKTSSFELFSERYLAPVVKI